MGYSAQAHGDHLDPDLYDPPELPGVCTANQILIDAAATVEQRGAERDKINGERSMRRTVEAFNALTGRDLSEVEGWLFMVVLKAARATGGAHKLDDYLDGAAYFALAGECAERGRG